VLSTTTSRTLHHHRCCSQADAGRAHSRALIALAIAYSQASLRPGVLFSSFFRWDIVALCVSICSSRYVRTVYFFAAMTTSTSTLASRGYHLHVILTGFYSSHSIRAITTLQLRGNVSSSDSTFGLFSSLTVCDAPAVTVGRYYSIFDRLYILYNRLSYILGYI
jgi:hypothetical protein